MNRKEELLKICLQLFKRCTDSYYVINLENETIMYDGVECDLYCLIEDIKIELGIEED